MDRDEILLNLYEQGATIQRAAMTMSRLGRASGDNMMDVQYAADRSLKLIAKLKELVK